jgi:hypothetical protein
MCVAVCVRVVVEVVVVVAVVWYQRYWKEGKILEILGERKKGRIIEIERRSWRDLPSFRYVSV